MLSFLQVAAFSFGLIGAACADGTNQIPLQHESAAYDPFTKSFDKYAESLLEEWYTPGVAIAVVRGDKTWTKGYGYADLDAKEPVTPFTLFHFASNTKLHTASIATLLVQDNETYKDITLETKLHDIDPLFQLGDIYESAETTLADALSHRTGMPRHDGSWIMANYTMRELVKKLEFLPRTAPFRTKWQYCNLIFIAVAHALEVITERSIGDLFTSWLWRPLNMTNSYFTVEEAQTCRHSNDACRLSKHYAWSGSQQRFIERDFTALPPADGAAGWIANAHDAAKWIRALAQSNGPISQEGHEMTRSVMSIPDNSKLNVIGPAWYGLGVFGGMYRGHEFFFHGGAIGAYYSHILSIPDLGFGIAIMENAPSPLTVILRQRLVDDLLLVPQKERLDMNAKSHDDWEKLKKTRENEPRALYPEVSSPPQLPALRASDYAGTYTDLGYGDFTLVPGPPSTGLYKDRPVPDHGSNMILHASAGLLDAVMVFYHVSGENWLVMAHDHETVDDDVPDIYTKARSIIGADGKIEAFHIIFEPSAKGEDAWVKLVRKET